MRALLAALGALAAAAYCQLQMPGLLGVDGFYHIKFAELLRTRGFITEFPWAPLSLWTDMFFDKDPLYHLYLVPFTLTGDLAAGMKAASILLSAAVVFAFHTAVRRQGSPRPWLWTGLLLISGEVFLVRLNLPRPHVLSMLLAVITFHLVLQRERRALAAAAFVYGLAYPSFYLPFAFAVLGSLARRGVDGRFDRDTPTAALAGAACGFLLQPYFPASLWGFAQTNFVVWRNLGGGGLRLGGEYGPMDLRGLLVMQGAATWPLVAACAAALFDPRRLDARARAGLAVAVPLTLIVLSAKRFSEYAVPLSLMVSALALDPVLDRRFALARLRAGEAGALAGVSLAALLVVFAAARTHAAAVPLFRDSLERFAGVSRHLRAHAEPGEIVFTCDFGDAPELWYRDLERRYLVFLDPHQLHLASPLRWDTWRRLVRGTFGANSGRVIRETFRSRWAACGARFLPFRRALEAVPGAELVVDDGRAYLFRLPGPPPD